MIQAASPTHTLPQSLITLITNRPMPHRFLDPILAPVFGFLGAGISTLALWLADVAAGVSPVSKGWIELGGTLGLIGCLSYACLTLWKSLDRQRKEATEERDKHHLEIAKLNLEIRTEKREQNDKLIEVLNKLDPDTR